MQTTILSLSQDEDLTSTRALILEAVGYSTVTTDNLSHATRFAIGCEMAIIDQTFTLDQQHDFVDRMHEANPTILHPLLTARHHFARRPPQGCFRLLQKTNLRKHREAALWKTVW
jgi:hypothetical protein